MAELQPIQPLRVYPSGVTAGPSPVVPAAADNCQLSPVIPSRSEVLARLRGARAAGAVPSPVLLELCRRYDIDPHALTYAVPCEVVDERSEREKAREYLAEVRERFWAGRDNCDIPDSWA